MSPPRRVRLRAGGTQAIAHTLRPELDAAGVEEAVAGTLREVRARGDDALVDGARRFDCPGFTHDRLRVPRAAIDRAVDALSEELRTAIVTAASQVRVVAEALLPDDRAVTLPYGQRVQVRQVPVDAAGCYAPGGRAAYPSSLVMGVVPAQVAGVGRIVAVSPPGADGRPSSVVLATAGLTVAERRGAAAAARMPADDLAKRLQVRLDIAPRRRPADAQSQRAIGEVGRHAHGLELVQHRRRAHRVVHGNGLCDFELEILRRQLRFFEHGGDDRRQILLVKLTGRHIDRHGAGDQTLLAPCALLGACLAQHPLAEADDHPGLLGQRDELARQQQPALRMQPA